MSKFEEAERIVDPWRELPAPSGSEARYEAHYNSIDKAFWFYDAGADEWHKLGGEDVGIAALYPIGEGIWGWNCQGKRAGRYGLDLSSGAPIYGSPPPPP